jgi:hypothetical protein
MSAGRIVPRPVLKKRMRGRLSIPDNIVSQRLIAPFGPPRANCASRAMIADSTKSGDLSFC